MTTRPDDMAEEAAHWAAVLAAARRAAVCHPCAREQRAQDLGGLLRDIAIGLALGVGLFAAVLLALAAITGAAA